MDKINLEQLKLMILEVCQGIIDSKDYLTELDSAIGDGDHGLGMEVGMNAVKKELLAMKNFENTNQIFKISGMAMINNMGGASGVIFGSMFLGCVIKGNNSKYFTCEEVPKQFRNALNTIKSRGGASLGDKTMVDALEPAVVGMEKYAGKDLVELFKIAAEESNKGVERSKSYVAKFGRAKYLGERSLGHQDAGATSVHLIFNCMYQFLLNL